MNNEQESPVVTQPKKKKGHIREYVEAILTAVLIAFFIRSFGIEAFKIPSSSMVPTLLIGDHIFVNKFVYGLRIPFTKIHFLEFKKPERGDVVVFIYPQDESKDFIKRVIGLPGDTIRIVDKKVLVNGVEIPSRPVTVDVAPSGKKLDVQGSQKIRVLPYFEGWNRYSFFEDYIGGQDVIVQFEGDIYRHSATFKVPENHLFVMGDNRDNSSDSREWGFVPLENLKGKAMFVWLSLDKDAGGIRLDRIGHWID